MTYDIKKNWDGPPRKGVPRKGLKDQTQGKGRGQRVLPRKVAENTYGGSGWDKSKVQSKGVGRG